MAGLVSDAEIAAIRAALEVTLVHTCTVTPVTVGADDAYGPDRDEGTPIVHVPCTYAVQDRLRLSEGDRVTVSIPTLTVSATAAIAVGYEVSNITDQLGVVMLPGPVTVERLLDDTAGLGAPLLPVWALRGGDVR